MKTFNKILLTLGFLFVTLQGVHAEKPAIKLSLNTQQGEVLNFYSRLESEVEEPFISQINHSTTNTVIITPENLIPFIKPEKEIDDLNLDTAKIVSEIVSLQ